MTSWDSGCLQSSKEKRTEDKSRSCSRLCFGSFAVSAGVAREHALELGPGLPGPGPPGLELAPEPPPGPEPGLEPELEHERPSSARPLRSFLSSGASFAYFDRSSRIYS